MARQGKPYLGLAAIQDQHPFDAAGSTWPSFDRTPVISCREGRAARISTLVQLILFRYLYAAAWTAYQDGDLEAVFPLGTYRLRRDHHVRVSGVDRPRATGPPPLAA